MTQEFIQMNISNETLTKLGSAYDIIRPMGNYIAVRMFEAEEVSAGGIFLPSNVRNQDKVPVAEVMAVGKGLRNNLGEGYLPVEAKKGDIAVLLRHAPVEVTLGKEKVVMISEQDVLFYIPRADFDALIAKKDEE